MEDSSRLNHTRWECKYHIWARGYFVSTVGIDEVVIREYIRNQEENDRKGDQNRLF